MVPRPAAPLRQRPHAAALPTRPPCPAAADTCSLRLEWEREGHSSAYSAAFFEAWMSGWDPSSGAELPRGLRNEIFCVIKGRKQRCSYELARPAGRDFTVFARNIWTEVGGQGSKGATAAAAARRRQQQQRQRWPAEAALLLRFALPQG